MLGKRKRQTKAISGSEVRSSRSDSSASDVDAPEIFRRHFETQFTPLPNIEKPAVVEEELEEEDESESESAWGGISEEDQNAIEVVEHADVHTRMAAVSKEELKSFMSSKPPTSAPPISIVRNPSATTVDGDDASEAANLKKDLALHRLLTESHLLDSANSSTAMGKNRHKATDLRLQALGAKSSIFKQEKMPMSERKGIIAKQTQREKARRDEARQNGIILEKVKMKSKMESGKRDRGVGAPGVGKFSGGTLRLSKKDIADIEGPRRGSNGRGGRGGGRGRGKRGK
ncbi:hypothetical protein BJ875DRAFT_90364 [Amylocarpus encephaloides]|uniref:Protein FAF1 n=1 Tax=Amylocarpus encephaloides TaxID=45428 RepID=A0A9P8C366_9HELO|nr:hypothetical protein BJ875DRAFT_90364 [Amylocarpus encephaloides]